MMIVGLTAFSINKKKKETYDYVITVTTKFGDMKLILFDDTPIHKSNFIKLAEAGKYDSTVFHRIIRNFMIQGGALKQKDRAGWDTLSFEKLTLPNDVVPSSEKVLGSKKTFGFSSPFFRYNTDWFCKPSFL